MHAGHLPLVTAANKLELRGTKATGVWTAWTRPRNASVIQLVAIGAGAGAACGGNSNYGSNGANSGSVSSLIVQARYLPKTLYLRAGALGLGGLYAVTGGLGPGEDSVIADSPSTAAANLILISSGGSSATVSKPGPYGAFGSFSTIAQQVGAAGNLGGSVPGVSVTFGASPVTGGAGGGGGPYAGGGIIGGGLVPSIPGPTGTIGANGFENIEPLLSTGGCGGYSGFPGGKGGLGSGGGGAGGASDGGDGGPGYIGAWWW